MFGIGGQEILVIGVLGLVVFGPNKLTQMARDLGRFVAQARTLIDEYKAELNLTEEPESEEYEGYEEYGEDEDWTGDEEWDEEPEAGLEQSFEEELEPDELFEETEEGYDGEQEEAQAQERTRLTEEVS